jgi:hypothetical protein
VEVEKKMKSNNVLKMVLSVFVLFVLLGSSVQAINPVSIKKTVKTTTTSGWYWKQSYPNYAPEGLPDFDQQQDRWMKISPGPNGVIDSTVEGDDILNTDENCIAPGPDCYLNSTAVGDDVEEYVFCGPVAIANCLWWFDSKYSDPAGTPGDGQDQFALVQDYGAGDDHATNNTPLLIENLARDMKTTEKGTTYITDMQSAIVSWLNTTGLSDKFTEQTVDRPTFSAIENQIEQGQNVILLLGSYDYVSGDLLVDQSQLSGPHNDLLAIQTWWDYQSFVPTAQRLDALEILLVSNSATPCDVQVNVYDSNHGSLIGTAIVSPGILASPTWVQFDFTPFVPLNPGQTYFFDVLQLDSDYHYEWMFNYPNPYPPGQGWMNNVPTDTYGHPFDWAFKTEFYSPPPGSVRRGGHYVTCAGVNSNESMIAFSDPTLDVANETQENHNDAQYVSHDTYNITTGSPRPDINTQWWLPEYPGSTQYTVVEQAVIICPVPDTTPPTVEITNPTNALYFLNKEIFPLSVPVIIGMIDVNVTATDADSGIDHVEFLVDLQYKANDTTAPYSWTWTEKSFFYYTIRVVAYDKAGNSNFAELRVWKFF